VSTGEEEEPKVSVLHQVLLGAASTKDTTPDIHQACREPPTIASINCSNTCILKRLVHNSLSAENPDRSLSAKGKTI
jgi:hypothetical protein